MNLFYICILAATTLIANATNNPKITSSRVTFVQQVQNPNPHKQVRICADFGQVSHFIRTELEPLFQPVLDLLPQVYQIFLQEQTKFKISMASCLFLSLILLIFLSSWFFVSKSISKKTLDSSIQFQTEIISLNLTLKELSLQNELLLCQATDYNSKFDASQSLLEIKEVQFNELNKKFLNLNNLNQSLQEKIDSMSLNEKKIQLELDGLRQSYESLKNEQTQSKFLTDNLNDQVDKLKILESQLRQELAFKQTNIDKLESVVSSRPNLDCINQQCGKIIIDLKKEIVNLECKMEQYEQLNDSYQSQLDQKDSLIKNLELKMEENERSLRENELQIKLLNDLREKDTKQHIKSLSEMDMELKRKSCQSDKMSHLYEQLRAKQEKVQDLEIQMAKMEKQWNSERQSFEKQVHENWLNGKKVEKELKDAKTELGTLTDRFNNLLTENNQLRQQNKCSYQADNSLNDNKTDHPLQIDTYHQFEQSRPSSATSSSSGINSGIGGPHMPAFYARFPFKHPYTVSSPNPDFSQMPPMPFNYSAYQQIMYKMMMQSRSACSSQQPSPCPNFPTSASYPNSLNDSMQRNGNQVFNDEKSETNEQSNV
ncbi:hypothetical protein BpHYR1_046032 [Brachionus plicatilis]|uniref:Uncharacterized protein n=1 Tax=Brachionus plicatilis TaxID=10195 RepID=A0A3M7SBY3_BRAPC|nr:hypothetical protein BpHYR1_046032 [Brachionus plicatilis]